ncbi:Hypothetical protein PHPALM_2168, partial [Phytophthora palmivora]
MAGRRLVRPKQHRQVTSPLLWLWKTGKTKVDVVAQQVLDHDDGIFLAVRANDVDTALRLIDADENCLTMRDSVGAAPIHIAFLFGHYDLGKCLVLRCRALATLTYTSGDAHEPSPYEGENILHIAIIRRQKDLVQWLVGGRRKQGQVERQGSFLHPTKACYFGGTPLLFALASNQIDMALQILEAAERLQDGPLMEGIRVMGRWLRLRQRYGNNIGVRTGIRDLPDVYDFALR